MRNGGRVFGALFFALFSGSAFADEDAVRRLASAYNGFGQEIFSSLEKRKGNIVYSPYSTGVAFSMAMSGASGETRAEFLKVMGFSQSAAEIENANGELAALFAGYAKEQSDQAGVASDAAVACLQKPDAKLADCVAEGRAVAKSPQLLIELNVANLLAIAKGPVSQPYKTLIAGKYGGEIFENTTPKQIDAWVAERTKGHITHVVDWSPDEALAFVLANAVYFHGSWSDPFDARATRPRPFTTASGDKVNIATMEKRARLPYLDGEAFEIAWLPYRNDALGMMLVLPKEGFSPETARARIVEEGFAKSLDRLMKRRETRLDFRLPRFSTHSEAMDLVGPTKALGLTRPFDPKHADFSLMSPDKLYIDQALQKTSLEVTEEGTVAAAVTTTGFAELSAPTPPKPFYIDHPFLFFIVDRKSGAILFQGRIEDLR